MNIIQGKSLITCLLKARNIHRTASSIQQKRKNENKPPDFQPFPPPNKSVRVDVGRGIIRKRLWGGETERLISRRLFCRFGAQGGGYATLERRKFRSVSRICAALICRPNAPLILVADLSIQRYVWISVESHLRRVDLSGKWFSSWAS